MVLKELNPRSRPEAEEQTAAGRPAVGPGVYLLMAALSAVMLGPVIWGHLQLFALVESMIREIAGLFR